MIPNPTAGKAVGALLFTGTRTSRRFFYRAGFIESWGRGIRKIVDGMTKAGLPRPKIEDADDGVRITIFRKPCVPENVPEELTGIKKRIYELIKANPSVSRTQIAVEYGMSVKTIGRYLAGMEKFVRHVGPARGSHWEIVTPTGRK